MKMNSRFAPALCLSVGFSLLLTACGGPKAGGGGGMPAMPVVTAEAKAAPLAERIELVGTLEAGLRVDVRSQTAGEVDHVGFSEGSAVKAGQVLFRIDERKLNAALHEAEADLALAESELRRAESLAAEKVLSGFDLDRARQAKAREEARVQLERERLADAAVVAPIDGIAGARNVDRGQVVTSGQVLTTLVNATELEVSFPVPEQASARLHIGLPVEAEVAAYPGEHFAGQVVYVSPQSDAATRTILAKARVAGARKLKPGMFAKLALLVAERAEAITIPEKAIVIQGGAALVVVVGAENKVEFRPVQVGLRQQGMVEILEGVKAGEKVVVEGHQKLFPGATVRES